MIFGLEDMNLQTADLNGDNDVSILDVIILIGMILDNHATDATHGYLLDTNGEVTLSSDGYIGGVQMTLSHDSDFTIELTDQSLVSKYLTQDNTTTLIIAAPYTEHLFTVSGDYSITDMIVANSSEEITVSTPSMFTLESAYPNPFNPTTTISFSVPNYDFVSIKVYDINGKLVSVLVEDSFNQGTHSITWDGTDFPSGQYLVKMKSGSFSKTQIISLIK